MSSELGFPVNKESTASSVLCMKCRKEFDTFEKFFEGLRFLKRRLIRRSRSREKCHNGELTWTECKGATKVRRLRAQAAQKHRRERQIIDRSFDGNFGEFGPFLWDLWSLELERSASESPAFPFFLLLVQLKILNVDKTASKWL